MLNTRMFQEKKIILENYFSKLFVAEEKQWKKSCEWLDVRRAKRKSFAANFKISISNIRPQFFLLEDQSPHIRCSVACNRQPLPTLS
jgi:hypothetical protein